MVITSSQLGKGDKLLFEQTLSTNHFREEYQDIVHNIVTISRLDGNYVWIHEDGGRFRSNLIYFSKVIKNNKIYDFEY